MGYYQLKVNLYFVLSCSFLFASCDVFDVAQDDGITTSSAMSLKYSNTPRQVSMTR